MTSIIKISERRGDTVEAMNCIFLSGLHSLLTLSSHHKAPRGYLYYIRHRDKIFKRRKCHMRSNRSGSSTIKFHRELRKEEIPTVVIEKPEFVLPSEPRYLIDKKGRKHSFDWVIKEGKYLRRVKGNYKHRKCLNRRK